MGIEDPLSSAAQQGTEEEDQVDVPLGGPQPVEAGQPEGPRTPCTSVDFTPTSVNTVASYGQLLGGGPPPYEDATLFDQVELKQPGDAAAAADAARGGGRAGPDPQNPDAAAATSVTVDDPVKHAEQSFLPGVGGGFVTYRVTARSRAPGWPQPQASVRRRFRDFVALHDTLKLTHRGYIVPPRPEKAPVEGQRASEEFLQARRAGLQRYLAQLAAHPVLGASDELRVFLTAEGPLSASLDWQQLQPLQGTFLDGAVRLPRQLIGQEAAFPSAAESVQPARQGGDLLRRLKEMRQAVRNDRVEPPRLDAGETALREERRQLEEMQERIADASRKAERAVAAGEAAGCALGDLGLALVKLARFEDEQGAALGQYTQRGAPTQATAADCKRTGMAAVRLSRLAKAASAQTVAALEPLHTCLALCPAALKALREREAQQLTVQALEADAAGKQKALHALEEQAARSFGNDAARARKQGGLENDLAALELSLEAARAEAAKIAGRNREELARWQAERRADFSAMQEAFLRVEAALQERTQSVWQAVAEEFGGPPPA